MRAGFDDPDRGVGCSVFGIPCPIFRLKPIAELERQKIAKQTADADTREKVPIFTDIVLFFFIKSIIGTIQREVHKCRERNGSLGSYFIGNFL